MFAVIPAVNMMYRPLFLTALATMSIWSARGQFAPAVPVLLNTQLVDRALAIDLDGDSDEDLLLGRAVPYRLVWLENDGLGSFSAEVVLRSGLGADMPFDAADLDDDGDPDVLFFDATDTTIYWRENDGTGGFGVEHLLAFVPNTYTVVTLRAGDLTSDGLPDVACTIDGGVRFWRNTGATFLSTDTVQFVGGPVPKVLGVADMNADGAIDLVTANWTGFVTLSENADGVGGAWATQTLPSIGLMSTADNFSFVDLDGDGDTDIMDAAHQRRWLRNEAIGTGNWPSFTEAFVDGGGPFHTAGVVAEFGCGGGIDFIYSTIPANEPVFRVSMDPASGEFGSPQQLQMLPKCQYMTLGDFDGDGAQDLLAIHGDTLSWFANQLPQNTVAPVAPGLDTLCINAPLYDLPEGIPVGGVWSGPNVQGGAFDALGVGPGSYGLTYTVLDTSGCSASTTTALVVISQPTISPSSTINCPSGDTLQFTAIPVGGSWGGSLDSTGYVNTACVVRPFFLSVSYLYTDVAGGLCFATVPAFEVLSCASIGLGDYGPYCTNDTVQQIVATGPAGGYVVLSGDVDSVQTMPPATATGQFDPGQGAGIYTVTATVNGPGMCPDSTAVMIEVYQAPSVALSLPPDTVFACGTVWPLYGGTPDGGLYYIDTLPAPVTEFDHLFVGLGEHVFTYTYVDPDNGCAVSVSDTVLIDCITTTSEFQLRPETRVWPNPSSGLVHLGFENAGPHDVVLLNAMGVAVVRMSVYGEQKILDMSHVPVGCYQLLADGSRTALVRTY